MIGAAETVHPLGDNEYMIVLDNEPLVMPLLGLDNEFPDNLYVLHHAPTKRYGCYCHRGIHGLACFSTREGVREFGDHIELSGLSAQEVTFDEAREIAKQRPVLVTAMMLLDNILDPIIHYVR